MLRKFQSCSQGNSKDTQTLKYERFAQIAVSKPSSLPEQRKIGALFSRLDDLIALHQRKLESLKNIKKALLGKMFA